MEPRCRHSKGWTAQRPEGLATGGNVSDRDRLDASLVLNWLRLARMVWAPEAFERGLKRLESLPAE